MRVWLRMTSPSPTPRDKRIQVDDDEDVLSVEPFEARFTVTIDDDVPSLTVDDDLNVTNVREGMTAESVC